MSQINKNFNTDQVIELLEKYLSKEIEREYIQEILGVKRRRFFNILKDYRENKELFSIEYKRNHSKRIDAEIEKNIIKELSIDKSMIRSPQIAIRSYNYSYIKKRLENKFNQKVSVPTIINRAKENEFYIKRKKNT